MTTKRWAVLLCVGLSATTACGSHSADDYAGRLGQELRSLTAPSGASVRSDSSPCTTGLAWSFTTRGRSQDYSKWVRAQLSTRFAELPSSPNRLAFSRHVQGDMQSLVIEAVPRQDSLLVRAALCVYPD